MYLHFNNNFNIFLLSAGLKFDLLLLYITVIFFEKYLQVDDGLQNKYVF